MMDGILDTFTERVKTVTIRAPRLRYLSCTTGEWITDQEATDPQYWAHHLRQTVRFSPAIEKLRAIPNAILLEVGPGNTLQTLARQHAAPQGIEQTILSSLVNPLPTGKSETESLLNNLGKLWIKGVTPNWNLFYAHEQRRRVSLPTYSFDKKRHWIEKAKIEHIAERTDTRSADTNQAVNDQTEAIVQQETNMNLTLEPTVGESSRSSRRDRLRTELTSILQQLSGMGEESLDAGTMFLELGFDSLFLTQVAAAVQKKFGFTVTFRQLLDRQDCIEALAEYLDEKLPASVLAEEPAKPVPTPAVPVAIPAGLPTISSLQAQTTRSSAPATGVEQIFKDQLQAMSQLITRQLEFLAGDGIVQQPVAAQQPISVEVTKPVEEPKSSKEFKPFGPYKPVQRGHADELTDQQRTYLNGLISRYTKKTRQSKEWTQKYRRVLADPRVVSGFTVQWKELVYPIVTNRSRGSRLWDIDGNEYIDLLNGFGPIELGHLPEFVKEAVLRQLEQGIEIGPQTQLAGEVAELLCELTGTERATFCNTGSEAVMAAMRLARTVTARSKIVLFAGDYHGNFEEVLVKKIGGAGSYKAGPIAPGIPPEMVQNMVVLDYGTPESLEYIRQNASELAAILVEPIQSRHPALQPRDFLKAVREITTASGTALIFDEIVTGFRVHQGGSQAYYGIQADLATYGKVLGGGFPIGAIAGKPRFMDALDGGHWQYGDDSAPEVGVTFFAGTFVRHPLALAAAKAVLIHLKQAGPSLQENLAKRTAKLVEQLNEVFRRYSIPTQAESCGSVFYFSFTHKFRFGSLLYYNLREKGIHIQEGFPCFLTTAHTDEDQARVVSAFEASAREMAEGGLLGAVDSPSAADSQPVVAKPAVPKPAILEPPEPEEAPVTEAQLEIWLSAQLSPEANCAFNESFSLRLQGELDEQALRDSLTALVQRHQALRATFDSDGSRIHFRPKLDIALHAVDLTGAPVENRERQYREFLEQDASTPFDLVEGPLVRLALVRMDAKSHILVFTAHHIVCDGWSTNVLIGELAEMYSARRFGRTPDLQPRLPFGTWAHTQREEASKATEVESYWLKRFKSLPPVLDLPIDRSRASVKTYAGSTYRYTIGGEALKNIKKSAGRQGATLFNVMLAGFHSLLFRLTGQSDIVVGVPAAAQSLVQDKALVGHGVNFLALRGSLEENETFAQFLKKSKSSLLDAYEHQNYTYGTLVRKLSIIRDASRLPLIEVQFNLERIAAGVQFTGLELKVEPNPKRFVNFDIFFNAVEATDSLVIDCDFNTDLFDEATMERWLEHYETLLLHVANHPGETVLGFSLLNEGQQKEVIEAQKVTQSDYPRNSRVEDLISIQAKKTPRAGAVICDNEHLDYEQLEAKSNQLARYLRTQGVQSGSNVAICLDRCVDMLVAVLAVMKAGATYIPLDPMLPKERLELILTDAGVSVALSQSHVLETVGGICPQAIAVDMVQQEIASVDSAPLPTGGSVDDPAYIIYTSGSTGKPKGVAVSHGAVVNFLWSMLREPGIKSDDRLLAVTTLSFDIAGLELYLPLICGACVVIANQTTTHDGELLRKELLRSRISVMQATPATWRMLLDAGWEPNPSLKMLCGGEALPRPLANELTRNNDELWNMYGPTETTIWSAVSRVVSGDAPVRIGKPIANTQFYVLDTNQQLVPLGVPGELVIGGDGLAKGYYQRPELTAEKFISNHISPDLGDRLYRTGDLVKAHSDGTLEFLGRLDHQIKIRGFRVELGEIEAVLGRYPNIRDVVVVDREDAGVKHLVTYYTTYDGQAVNAADFKTFLFDKLPPYMAPSFFVLLEALPRTPNGKVDRRSLPAFDLNAVREKRPYRAPGSNQEKELAAICAEVLQLDKIGVDDNLLELGADSIQIFRIVARANKIGMGLTAQQVLRSPNIEGMAQSSSMAGPVKGKSRLSPIMPVWRTPYRVSDQKVTGIQTNGRQ
jgi:amino acid adenylation domain-containing protein